MSSILQIIPPPGAVPRRLAIMAVPNRNPASEAAAAAERRKEGGASPCVGAEKVAEEGEDGEGEEEGGGQKERGISL